MDLNKLKEIYFAAKILKNFTCLSAIIFASFDSKENDFSPPKSFLGQSAQVICKSFFLAFIVETMVFLTWMLHLMLGLKEKGWLSSIYLILTHFLWISVTIFGSKVPKCNIVSLLLELLVLIYVISIAAALVLKLLFLISRLFSIDNSPYEQTETKSSQNDLLHQSHVDINKDFLKENSINSEQYLPSTSFSKGDNFMGNTNMAGYFLSHPQNCGDVFTDRISQTKEHENGISRYLRIMQPQESYMRTLQSEYHQGPNMLQTEDRQGPHRKMLQTESPQVQPTRPFLTEDLQHQGPHREMLQTENHQGQFSRPLQTEDLQHQRPYRNMLQTDSHQGQPARLLPTEDLQGPQQKIKPTKTLLERRAEVKRSASEAGGINRLSSNQENIQQSKKEINSAGDHHGLHANMLQTEVHQGQPSIPLQTEALQHQGPQQKTTQTKTLLERRAEVKRAASGVGRINRFSSSQGNIQQSKGEINSMGDHHGLHTNVLQTEIHQGQPSRPLQTDDLHHQRPLQRVMPTKTLLERRAEAKIAASGAGGINRLYSKSVGNIQQSKGDTNNNSNKISDANTEVYNESSQGRRHDQPPAQNFVCTTRSGHIYKRF